jgi:hypothetical protein
MFYFAKTSYSSYEAFFCTKRVAEKAKYYELNRFYYNYPRFEFKRIFNPRDGYLMALFVSDLII